MKNSQKNITMYVYYMSLNNYLHYSICYSTDSVPDVVPRHSIRVYDEALILSNSATTRSHFRCRFWGSSLLRSQFLLFVFDRRWLASHLCCSSNASFLFAPSSFFPSHIVSFTSLFSFSFSLSLFLSYIPFASSRAELWGKRQGGGVDRGSRVDEGRRRETEGRRAVRWINLRLADGLSFVTLSPSYRLSFSPSSSSSSSTTASTSGSSHWLSFSLFAPVSRCSTTLSFSLALSYEIRWEVGR